MYDICVSIWVDIGCTANFCNNTLSHSKMYLVCDAAMHTMLLPSMAKAQCDSFLLLLVVDSFPSAQTNRQLYFDNHIN